MAEQIQKPVLRFGVRRRMVFLRRQKRAGLIYCPPPPKSLEEALARAGISSQELAAELEAAR